MWPPGMPSSASISSGVMTSTHGSPSAVEGEAGLQRLGKHRLQGAQRRVFRPLSRAFRIGSKQASRGVHPEESEGVVASSPKLRIKDRAIGQRVAIDLAGHRIRYLAGRCRLVRLLQPLITLTQVQCAGEADDRLDPRTETRKPPHYDVDLGLTADEVVRAAHPAVAAASPEHS